MGQDASWRFLRMTSGISNSPKTFHLPIRPVYDPEEQEEQIREEVRQGKRCWPGEGLSINSGSGHLSLNGLTVEEAKKRSWNG